MKPERKICIELRDFLIDKDWEIKSFNPPGLHGGLILLDRGQKRGKGSIKPDIIAKKEDCILIIEAKPKFYRGDVIKLDNINMNHVAYLQTKLNLPNSWRQHFKKKLQKALCLAEFKPSKSLLPDNYLLFHVRLKGIRVHFGKDCVCKKTMFDPS